MGLLFPDDMNPFYVIFIIFGVWALIFIVGAVISAFFKLMKRLGGL